MAALVAILALVVTSCDSGGSSSSSNKKGSKPPSSGAAGAQNASTAPTGAEAAIAEYLKGQGLEYAGDCADASLPQDKGKWCSTLVSSDSTAGTQTYDVGPVGEKAQKAITVKPHGAARLTPGFQVGVGDSNVGTPQELSRDQLAGDAFITGNLQLDQTAGIGNGLTDLPPGAPSGNTGGTGNNGNNGGTGGNNGGNTPPVTVPGGGGTGQYPPQGQIVVENPSVQVGGEAAFKGSGCVPNETLQVLFDGQPIGTITSDASGAFAGSISIPKGTAPGSHLITVQGSGCVFNTTITVVGALAFTGSSNHTTTYVLAGFAAVVVGLVLVVGTRRRRHGVRGRSSSP